MKSAGRILVTPRSVTRDGHPSLARLEAAGHEVAFGPPGRQPTEEELLHLLPDCVGYLAGVEPVTAGVLRGAGKLRAISRNGTGVDNVDLATAAAQGIAVLRAEGANARGVAELALALMLALARAIPECDAAMKAGGWQRSQGIELEGKTLGLLGWGRIGRLVGGFGAVLGMEVLAHDPMIPAGTVTTPARLTSFAEVLTQSDFLSLHCPPAPGGQPLLDEAALTRMKPGVRIINTARFELIDTKAMLHALDHGHVAGLALDVFDAEPPRDLSLVRHPRVIATPHAGGFTRESVDRAMDVAVDNILRALENPGPTPRRASCP
ncbi:conserved hypothetical protein [uncultured Defluviicoccus sp.]|uniref:D-3-phosphoglycerate dehydrogenase n=1 Tax=metagenome TaxID=256318 RepID=A0A380TFP4_9ZZZZ|nr:conserved hypothetical protein [uncultured Defluviicoccus sp.]